MDGQQRVSHPEVFAAGDVASPIDTTHAKSGGVRRGMPIERALAIIAENIGAQFDRAFGERFVAQGKVDALHCTASLVIAMKKFLCTNA